LRARAELTGGVDERSQGRESRTLRDWRPGSSGRVRLPLPTVRKDIAPLPLRRKNRVVRRRFVTKLAKEIDHA
jgi:hypothetical protein